MKLGDKLSPFFVLFGTFFALYCSVIKISIAMKKYNDFEAAKYGNKWAVFDKVSKTFSFIGCGKRFCQKKAKELNDYCRQKDMEENSAK